MTQWEGSEDTRAVAVACKGGVGDSCVLSGVRRLLNGLLGLS